MRAFPPVNHFSTPNLGLCNPQSLGKLPSFLQNAPTAGLPRPARPPRGAERRVALSVGWGQSPAGPHLPGRPSQDKMSVWPEHSAGLGARLAPRTRRHLLQRSPVRWVWEHRWAAGLEEEMPVGPAARGPPRSLAKSHLESEQQVGRSSSGAASHASSRVTSSSQRRPSFSQA